MLIKALLQQHLLAIDTIHGPRADKQDSVKQLTAVAHAAVDLDVPVVVMHAGPFDFDQAARPAYLDIVLQTCASLEPVARETGVVFALENVLPGPATELVELALAQLSPHYFGFCYDSSYDQIGGPRPL